MTATLFFSISVFVFIFHLPRPLSESTGSAKEAVGATSSTTSNLDNIKQRLVNSIEKLLDSNNTHNSGLDNNKEQQQNNIMSSSDQTTAQTAAQATVPPTMVPSSAGTSSTSVLPELNPTTLSKDSLIRQLNAVTISMKLPDNNLYQTASTTLLNLYDNFSAVVFLANSTPINLSDNVPILKHVSDFINNMKPSQRSSSTSAATEWFHLFDGGRKSTLPTSPTSPDSTIQPSSATTTSSSFRQHLSERPTIQHCTSTPSFSSQHRAQHGQNITDHPASLSWRQHLVQQWHQRLSGATSSASFKVVQHQHSAF